MKQISVAKLKHLKSMKTKIETFKYEFLNLKYEQTQKLIFFYLKVFQSFSWSGGGKHFLELNHNKKDGIAYDHFGFTRLEKVRRCLWNILEYPETSFAARVSTQAFQRYTIFAYNRHYGASPPNICTQCAYSTNYLRYRCTNIYLWELQEVHW